MRIRKKIMFLLSMAALCFTMVGCSLPYLSESNASSSSEDSEISYTSYDKVNSQEDIFSALLKTMQSNKNKCYFFVTSQDMIDADSWLNQLNGIEEIHCEYRRIKDGYNVVVTLSYWDNYSIINAYKTRSTDLLSEKQLELYNKYCEVLEQYTSPEASDWDNELAIHDYLVSNIRYELGDDSIYNAYDALINGTAVCNGYTECFKTFMDMLEIECLAISGTAGDELHIWNLVKLDEEWYQVDVTWDDPINGDGSIEHAYFNITDATMAKDHIWDTSIYPPATGTAHSYPKVKGLPYFTNEAELTSFFLVNLNKRVNSVEFMSTSSFDLKSLIEKCGLNVSYSYNISDYNSYFLYRLEFTY